MLTAKPMRFDHTHERLLTATCEMNGSLGLAVLIECFGDVGDSHNGACSAGCFWKRHLFKEGPILFSELDFSAVVLHTNLTAGAADFVLGSRACSVVTVNPIGIADVTASDTWDQR